MGISVSIDSSKELNVHVGDVVGFSTPLYKTHKKEEQRIELAEQLSINPKLIFSHIKKAVGDTVLSGEMIAEKKSLFKQKKIFAEIEGVIKEIDHIEGVVLIETKTAEKSENCWFAGEITSITKRQIELKIGKHQKCAAKNISKDFGGETYFFRPNESIPSKPVGIGEHINSYDAAKLSALSGAGLITVYEYKEHIDMPKALFKLKSDYEEIVAKQFSYCLTQSEHSTIIFYSL